MKIHKNTKQEVDSEIKEKLEEINNKKLATFKKDIRLLQKPRYDFF